MYKYRDTENEAVRLMMFPLSLTEEAKTWLAELNEGTIETWDELRTTFISRFFPPTLFDRLLGDIRAFSQHENESLTDAWLRKKEMLDNAFTMVIICPKEYHITKTYPQKRIHEFLGIYDMYKYRDTKNEVVRLMMFPLSLTGEAKTWLDELNEGTIKKWDELRTAFISRFFPSSLFDRLLGEIRAFSQHENESLTDAWLRMKEMLRNAFTMVTICPKATL
ncbi:reverse transcriptase domain-containing protein [Tanacetum coccineum]